MKEKEKETVTYTKEMMIRKISNDCHRDSKMVRTIYNTLEESIFDILSSADDNKDTSIRLFEGITIGSTYIPEKTKVNNLTGETIIASSKIKPKANITRNYREKLTSHNK